MKFIENYCLACFFTITPFNFVCAGELAGPLPIKPNHGQMVVDGSQVKRTTSTVIQHYQKLGWVVWQITPSMCAHEEDQLSPFLSRVDGVFWVYRKQEGPIFNPWVDLATLPLAFCDHGRGMKG